MSRLGGGLPPQKICGACRDIGHERTAVNGMEKGGIMFRIGSYLRWSLPWSIEHNQSRVLLATDPTVDLVSFEDN